MFTAYGLNWTELNWTEFANCSARTAALQPINVVTLTRVTNDASCNLVNFVQVRSVQFSSSAVNRASPTCRNMPIMCKYDVIHKTGSTSRLATSPEEDRAKKIGNLLKKLMMTIRRVVSEIGSRTDRHRTVTDRFIYHRLLPYQRQRKNSRHTLAVLSTWAFAVYVQCTSCYSSGSQSPHRCCPFANKMAYIDRGQDW